MTKRTTWCRMALAVLALTVVGQAGAEAPYHDLTIAGWMVGKQVAYTNMGDFYAGAFTWAWDGGAVNSTSPLYCLDVRNSFSGMPSTWEVTRHIVPPDPQSPPPYNTDHAAWIYYNHGTLAKLNAFADKATRAAAVQLALWEVSHDLNWATTENGWLSGGSFFWDGNATSAVKLQANDMLHSLHAALDAQKRVSPVRPAYWYQPKGWPDPNNGQGQLGEAPVPEPGTIVLLGLGLVAAGGAAWRRRK